MKFVWRTTQALLVLLALAILGIVFYPVSEYEPKYRELRDESSSDFENKVGWYRLADHSTRLLTWSARHGLTLYRFGLERDSLARTTFSVRSDSVVVASPLSKFDRIEFGTASHAAQGDARLMLRDGTSQTLERVALPDYETREVRFSNDDIELAALLFVPVGPGLRPAVVFSHGSGDSDRDNFWYLSPADHLAREGVVVLLPDKRGSGKSGGEWHTASFDDFAGDALAAIEWLSQHPSVDRSRMGVVGFSQGGWVAPLAAKRSGDISFVVTVSGSLARPVDQVAYEVQNDIADSGVPTFVAGGVAPLFSWRAKRRQPEWWKLNGDFDPIVHWQDVSVPTLIIFGADDRNVDVARSLSLLKTSGLSKVSTVETLVLADRSHTLISPESGWVDAEYLREMTSFVLSNGKNSSVRSE